MPFDPEASRQKSIIPRNKKKKFFFFAMQQHLGASLTMQRCLGAAARHRIASAKHLPRQHREEKKLFFFSLVMRGNATASLRKASTREEAFRIKHQASYRGHGASIAKKKKKKKTFFFFFFFLLSGGAVPSTPRAPPPLSETRQSGDSIAKKLLSCIGCSICGRCCIGQRCMTRRQRLREHLRWLHRSTTAQSIEKKKKFFFLL